MATLRQCSGTVRIYAWPSGKENAIYGGRIRPVERMEPRHESRMASLPIRTAAGLATAGARSQLAPSQRTGVTRSRSRMDRVSVDRLQRRPTLCDRFPPQSQGLDGPDRLCL